MPTDVLTNPPQILMLPIDDLAVPDWNPRKVVFEEPLKNLMAYIQAGGKLPRILVWKGNGQAPWAIISGQRRREALKRLGTTQVEVEVMDIPLEQAEFLAMGSNEGEPVFWLDWDIRAEKLYQQGNQDGQKLTQADLGARLGVTQSRISYALKTVAVLTPAARTLIYDAVIKSGDSDQVKERPIQALAALGDAAGVEKALPRVIEGQMTEGQVKTMVVALKAGTPAEGFKTTPPLKKRELASGGINPSPASQPQAVPTTPAQAVSQVAGGILWKKVKQIPGHVLNRVFPRSGRLLHLMAAGMGKLGIKNQFWATAITLFLLLWVAGTVVHFAERLISRALLKMVYSRHEEPAQTQAVAPVTAIPAQVPVKSTGVYPPIGHKPMGKSGLSQIKAPSKGKAPKSDLGQPATAPVVVGKTIPAWAQDDLPAAGEFANRFYGISYSNWDETLNYLKAQMVGNGVQTMVAQYFPPSMLKEMQTKMLAQYFSVESSKVIGGEGDRAEILVQGTVTTLNRMGRNPQTVSTKPAALLLAFRLVEGFGSKIEKVTELDPGTVSKVESATVASKAPNADLGKQIGDGIHDAKDAVNKAGDASTAVDKAKNLLGF